MTPPNYLDKLKAQLELEGYVPGSPQFEAMLVVRKVQRCQEFQGAETCSACKAYEDCTLAREHRARLLRGGK